MQYEYDAYNGVIVGTENLTTDPVRFNETLCNAITKWRNDGKQLAWLTLPLEQSSHIPVATQCGFSFHNCHEHELTLILRLKPNAYAPFAPTHTIGAGGLVIDDQNRLLVIKERTTRYIGFKLPGGILETGELLSDGVEREVLEETGIESQFQKILGMISVHPFRFDNSNIYIVCQLKPLSEQINIEDTQEIEEAKWVPVDEYLSDENNLPINRKMVELSLNSADDKSGLEKIPFEHHTTNSKLREIFFRNKK